MQDVLNQVSENCLRGEQVPDDLRRIWDAKIGGNAEVLDDLECELLHEVGDELLEAYTGEDVEGPTQRAYEHMFQHISFFAVARDGALLGYWIGPHLNDITEAPVVQLDSEGQFQFVGANFAEYIAGASEGSFDKASQWLSSLGISLNVSDINEYMKSLEDITDSEGDPNDLSWSYQNEEQEGYGADEDMDDSPDDEM